MSDFNNSGFNLQYINCSFRKRQNFYFDFPTQVPHFGDGSHLLLLHILLFAKGEPWEVVGV